MNYYFSHRARKNAGTTRGINKIYVVIMPTRVAQAGVSGGVGEIDTREEVLKVKDDPEKYDAYVELFTSGTSWVDYQDEYIPTDSLTRFFFVSAEETDPTMGNYLDNVWFGQEIPVPSSNKFNLRIEKNVANLDYETFSKLKSELEFNIEVKDSNGTFVKDSTGTNALLTGKAVTLKAESMTWIPNSDGTYTGIYDYKNNEITGTYKISVTENKKELDGYTVTETSKHTVTSLGGASVEDIGSTDISVSKRNKQ